MINDKDLFLDALCGAGFPSVEFAENMAKRDYAVFIGDKYNPGWGWNREKLMEFSSNDLYAIYHQVRSEIKRNPLQRHYAAM